MKERGRRMGSGGRQEREGKREGRKSKEGKEGQKRERKKESQERPSKAGGTFQKEYTHTLVVATVYCSNNLVVHLES